MDAFANTLSFDAAFPNLSELLLRGNGHLAVQCAGSRSYDELRTWATFHALATSAFHSAPLVVRVVHDESDAAQYSLATLLCDLEACVSWMKDVGAVELWLCQPTSNFFEAHTIAREGSSEHIPLVRGDGSSPMAALVRAASLTPYDFALARVPGSSSASYLKYDACARLPRLCKLVQREHKKKPSKGRSGFSLGTAMVECGWSCAEISDGYGKLTWRLRGQERMHCVAAALASLELSLPSFTGSFEGAEPLFHVAYCKKLVDTEMQLIRARAPFPTVHDATSLGFAVSATDEDSSEQHSKRRIAMARMLSHDGFRESSLFHNYLAEAKAKQVRDDPLDELDRAVLSPPTSFD
jgi:hypothetical protein